MKPRPIRKRWSPEPKETNARKRRAFRVSTTWMPTVETPQTAAAGVPGAELNMRALAAVVAQASDAAGPGGPDPLRGALEPVVAAYAAWLDEQEAAVVALPEHLRGTGAEALTKARQVAWIRVSVILYCKLRIAN